MQGFGVAGELFEGVGEFIDAPGESVLPHSLEVRPLDAMLADVKALGVDAAASLVDERDPLLHGVVLGFLESWISRVNPAAGC
ncbi:hypothetical protein VDGD_20612 [Verticillium dahliae]|nr:hypothetical protein VDGD_20612 [Verticillium dahliae]